MTIKPVADLYLLTYEDGRSYKSTRDAEEAVDAIGAGFKVEEFVSLENHRAAMLQGADGTTGKTLANGDAVANCPKCGGHGSYHCMQMLGTVECECALQEVKQCT